MRLPVFAARTSLALLVLAPLIALAAGVTVPPYTRSVLPNGTVLLVMPRKDVPLIAFTARGTSCSACSRLVAVTMRSSVFVCAAASDATSAAAPLTWGAAMLVPSSATRPPPTRADSISTPGPDRSRG